MPESDVQSVDSLLITGGVFLDSAACFYTDFVTHFSSVPGNKLKQTFSSSFLDGSGSIPV